VLRFAIGKTSSEIFIRRDTPGAGTYDKVVSCEMIEAVGHEHLACYFATINAMLKPGGRAAIQASHALCLRQSPARVRTN